MSEQTVELSCEIELRPGEKLTLPQSLQDSIGPGRWLVTVQPLEGDRDHTAFLSGYAASDEGLYDDDPGR